jgi:outer membrane usher protein
MSVISRPGLRCLSRREGWRGGLVLLCAVAGPACADAPLLLAVRVNGETMGEFVPVLSRAQGFYVRARDLAAWRLAQQGTPRIEAGETYLPLPPDQVDFDAASQTLSIVADSAAFTPQHIDLRASPPVAAILPAVPGLALDYDAFVQLGSGEPQWAALLDVGAFGLSDAGGTFRQRVVASHGEMPLLRLETQWRHEAPQALRSWALGDSITCHGEFAGAARFAGVQVQRDFSLRPDLVTFPLPAIRGSASVPSALDLLVDGRAVGSTAVGPGLFQVDNPPLVSGAGELAVVQQDVLGRVQQVSVPYYVSPRLLRPGLTDYCAEAGWLRENYGLESNDYGSGFAALGGRIGLSPSLTVLGRVELGETRGLSLGGHWLAGGWGVLSAQLAASQGPAGRGGFAQLRAERQARSLSLAAVLEAATPDYRRLAGDMPPAWRAGLFAGAPLGRLRFSLAAVWQQGQDDAAIRLVSMAVSGQVGRHWFAQASVQSQNGEPAVLVSLSRSLGGATHLAVQAQAGDGRGQYSVQAQHSAPLAGGLGWRVLASEGQASRQQGGLDWLTRGGLFGLEAARDGQTDAHALRFNARGGLLWLDRSLIATRGLGEGSVALVNVPGFAGIPVLHQHRVVAVTDARGRAWVSGLLPNQANAISLDADALPIEVRLDRELLQVQAAARTAVKVDFPVQRERGALLVLVDDSGRPLPTGAQIIVGDGVEAFVGLHGEAYLASPPVQARLDVRWADRHCEADFALPRNADPQPRIGPLICREKT